MIEVRPPTDFRRQAAAECFWPPIVSRCFFELLVIADVPSRKVEAIAERIRKVHPKAKLEGMEPRVPALP